MATRLTSEQVQEIMQRTTTALQNPKIVTALGGPNEAKCWTCRIGLNAAAGAAISAAFAAIIASDGAALLPEVAAIAVATGLSEAAVTGILQALVAGGAAGGATAVEAAIEGLCKAMNACK